MKNLREYIDNINEGGASSVGQMAPQNVDIVTNPRAAGYYDKANQAKLQAQTQKQTTKTTTAAKPQPPAGGSATKTPVTPAKPASQKPAFVDQGTQFGYDTPEEVQQIQSQLKSMGYDIAVDGKFGPKTLAAYKQAYSQMYGQQPGQVDPNVPPQGATTTPAAPAKPATPQASTDELLAKAAEFTKAGDLSRAKLYTDLAARQGAKLREDIELNRIINLAKLK